MLKYLGIQCFQAEKGYEGEQLASYLVQNKYADAVISNDFDVLLFGSNKLITKKSKKMYLYNLADILDQHQINFKYS